MIPCLFYSFKDHLYCFPYIILFGDHFCNSTVTVMYTSQMQNISAGRFLYGTGEANMRQILFVIYIIISRYQSSYIQSIIYFSNLINYYKLVLIKCKVYLILRSKIVIHMPFNLLSKVWSFR